MYAKDMSQNGQHEQIAKMNRYADEIIKGKDIGSFWRTEGYQGYDCICLHPNRPGMSNYEGYILYSEVLDEPIFVKEPED
jgi:hypothetical protein